MLKKYILIGSGIGFTATGMIGIILPLLTTTPFLLLAAACFVKSSPKLYLWLINNKMFGKYIKNYRDNKGISLRVKITSLSFLWLSIAYSFLFVLENSYARALLIVIATGVTIHILKMKTLEESSIRESAIEELPTEESPTEELSKE